MSNRINIHTPSGFYESYDVIANLELLSDASLIIIDTITRLLDMSSNSPEMWGRELIEEILPTLAAFSKSKQVTIIIISESRYMGDDLTTAVLHRGIRRWIDHDLELKRPYLEKRSIIQRYDEDEILAYLVLNKDGRILIESKEEGGQCSEDCSVLSST
jgi:hypothetical protein